MPVTQFQSIISLSSLNGRNGFKIDGEMANDYNGASVSVIEDINGDQHADLMIGAPLNLYGFGVAPGRSYVIFGGPVLDGISFFNLTQLDGGNGFRLDGERNGDEAGYIVSGAGDVNGDGNADIWLNAPYSPDNGFIAGTQSIVFGGAQKMAQIAILHGGVLPLPNLDGFNGFRVYGPKGPPSIGPISQIGDINGDSYDDILTAVAGDYNPPGCPSGAGHAQVVFGGSTVGNLGTVIPVYDGISAFDICGGTENARIGSSLSGAGDVNHDGYADILIGASTASPGGLTNAGTVYVIFGSASIGSGGVLDLSTLNGTNGFRIDGEIAYDYFGSGLNSGGDLNGDAIDDLIIGAPSGYPAPARAGKSYVIFGSTSIGGNGTFLLSSLNGTNGYTLYGESAGDLLGYSLGPAGDFNRDQQDDFFISARGVSPAGRTYVVFGGPQVGASGSFALSKLNGTNGFKVNGEFSGDQSGYEVSTGDMNADGLIDLLIGAPYASPNQNLTTAGRTYIIWGDTSPQIFANQLIIHPTERVTLSTQNLNVTDNHPLVFKASNVQHGHFELISAPGQNITMFNESSLLSGQVQFVHDGSFVAPSYSIQPINDGIAASPPPNLANITFYFNPPILHTNQLSIHQGETVLMTSNFLNVTDDYPPTQVTFNITGVQHGQFLLLPVNNSVTYFTEQQLLAGQVTFAHDNSPTPPVYAVSVFDPYYSLSSAFANITFYHRPTWVNNQIPITERGTALISLSMLDVAADYPDAQIIFNVTAQHGQFQSVNTTNSSITQFTQAQVRSGQIQFCHDGSESAPSYQITVNDPYFTLSAVSGSVNYLPINDPPYLINNYLSAVQGRSMVLNPSDLSAGDPDSALPSLIFSVSNVEHGQFSFLQNSAASITQFTQAQISAAQVQFIPDGTRVAPSYQISVSDGSLSSGVLAGNVTLDTAPSWVNNRLTITPGETVILDITNLKAIDDFTPSGDLVFTAGDVQHGYFAQAQAPTVDITEFTQEQISGAEIQFVHDGSRQKPAYQVTVTDKVGLTTTKNADITFEVTSKVVSSDSVRNAIIGGVVSAVISLGAFGLKVWLGRKADEYFEKVGQEGVARDQADYQKNVIQPIAKRILARVDIKGFMGYISQQTMQDALDAITQIVHALERQGVEVDMRKLTHSRQSELLNTVARKTRQILVPEVSCCSATYLARFFTAETTPQQMEDKAKDIASAVKAALNFEPQSPSTQSVELAVRENKETTVEMEILRDGDSAAASTMVPATVSTSFS